ncbi:MAG TPA: hypothetical protein VG125_13015 [Pirellulales bacterium]|nr:hypothetical protein [Pirellulales bacterium]
MAYPHSIRLRGPWRFEPLTRSLAAPNGQILEQGGDLPPAGRGTVPSDWGSTLGAEFRGRVGYRRSFNPPGSLDPHERLWLVIEGVDARGMVSLNGRRLGEVPGYAVWSSFEITNVVGPRNEVLLEVELPAGEAPIRPGRQNLPGGPIGEVRLEVRSSRFVDGLAIWSSGEREERQFTVRGRIDGEPTESPLAVVIGACDHELAYLELRAGVQFEATFSAAETPVWTPTSPATVPIEVKLLEGGLSVWRQVLQAGFRIDVSSSDATRLDRILSEDEYLAFDQKGTTIIQHVPPEWAEAVCSRLAHHPSIVAWSAGPNEPPLGTLAFGRPWL